MEANQKKVIMSQDHEKLQGQIPSDPLSFLKLVNSKVLNKAARRTADSVWLLPDKELEALVQPTKAFKALKVAFWGALRHSIVDGSAVSLASLCRKAECNHDYIRQALAVKPDVVVWILRNPLDLSIELKYIGNDLLNDLNEILQLPIKDEDGRTNVRNVNAKMRALEVLFRLNDK